MPRRPVLFASVLLSTAAFLGWLTVYRDDAEPAGTADDSPLEADRPAAALASTSATDALAEPSVTLPVYIADTRGLPPADTPLRDSDAALREAAKNGNATAACRLAFTAIDCWSNPSFGPDATEASASAADLAYASGPDALTDMAARRINSAPPALRPYVRERFEAFELMRASAGDSIRQRARRCEGAPPISNGETSSLLRQAALAGQADAVVAYAHGKWMEAIFGINAARTPDQAPPPFEILRDPAFMVWRREAVAMHQAGLEAGLLPLLELEAMPNRMSVFDQLVRRDPVQQAAAVRALAGVVGSGAPPSTATLGLAPDQAAEADRLADRWAAAARARGETLGHARALSGMVDPMGGPPICE